MKAKSLREAKLEKELETARRMIDILVSDKNKLEDQYAQLDHNFSFIATLNLPRLKKIVDKLLEHDK